MRVHEYRPDSVDYRLIHALQVEPRATWRELAPVVGADATTLSRRWQRLSGEGIAWTTGIIDPIVQGGTALIEISCLPNDLADVAARLSEDREVSVLDYTSGDRDLLVTLSIGSVRELSRYVLERLGRLTGIQSARTHLVTEILVQGGGWRLRELNSSEVARIPLHRAPRARASRRVSAELQEAIGHALALDGRASVTAIAERTGASPQRVTDAISTLRSSGTLTIRTDMTREYSPWPVYTWYFVEVPAGSMNAIRSALPQIAEIRLAAVTASRHNLIMAVWLRNLAHVQSFEVAFGQLVSEARIADRAVVMRVAKHLGHLLDDSGRATGRVVPLVSGTA
jgi:DNA-binding Lrp family transcriptional regulator